MAMPPMNYSSACAQYFSEEELVNLTLAIVAINGWNRFAIGFRAPAGTYQVNIGLPS